MSIDMLKAAIVGLSLNRVGLVGKDPGRLGFTYSYSSQRDDETGKELLRAFARFE